MSEADENAVGIAAVAVMLGVSKDTVYGMARSGRIPGFRIGEGTRRPEWRFWPSEVRQALAPKPRDVWAMPAASRRARRAS